MKNLNDYNNCKIEALKYESKSKFKKESSKHYSKIIKNKWYELINHIPNKCKTRSYDECKEEALKFDNKKLFSKTPHYAIIIKKKWYELIIHMENFKPKGYWTYDRCKEEALKYSDRQDFLKNSKGCRYVIYNNKWFELLDHMILKGHKYKRLVYAYEFENNYVYVGITSDISRRNSQHIDNDTTSAVYQHKIEYHITPILHIKTEYIDVEEAIKMEEEILSSYRNNNWNILNKVKTGSIGGASLIWTKYKCEEELKKYKSYPEFRKNCGGGANSIYKNKWIDLYSKNYSFEMN